MGILNNKIDFVALLSVTMANPNGDPLNGNRPRENYSGYGIMSDVAIKRKIRNRLQDMGENIFVQSDGREDDGCRSLKERADKYKEIKDEIDRKKQADADKISKLACEKWFDVRAFGQVFAFKGFEVSVGVRGPVSVHQAISASAINTVDMQITKSVNSEQTAGNKASDTMGMKHYVEYGLYKVQGSISCQLAEKTGFTDEDADMIKKALSTLFENDASAARPDGSCEVRRLYWWKHNEKTPKENSAKIFRSVQIKQKNSDERPTCFEDYEIVLNETDCKPEIIEN